MMNRMRVLRFATVSIGALSLALSASAFAQEAAPQVADEVEQAGLEDIIVTATKRNENLQNVPVSVTAITTEQLTKQGVFSTTDLNNSIPNLQVSSAYGETQPNFTIRGIGVGTEYNSNAASPVGIYVDEVYQSFRASHGQQLYDLEQVEVVRGPQGTLFGRNTTGGAINFITRKPRLKEEPTGYGTLGYGSFNRISAEGALELSPVAGKVGVRIAGNYVDSDPYVKNIFPKGLVKSSPFLPDQFAFGDMNTGNDPGGHESWGVRGQVRFVPTDTIDLNFKAYVSQSNGGQDSPQNHGPSRTDDTIDMSRPPAALAFFYTPFANTFYGTSQNLALLFPQPYSADARGLSSREIEGNSIGTAATKTFGAVFNAKAELTDTLSLTSITGYDRTRFALLPKIDCDGTPYNVCAIGYDSLSRSFNQDLRLDYRADRLKAIVGVYYGYDKIVTNNTPDFFGFLSDVNLALGNPRTYFNPGGLVNPAAMITALKATQDYTQVRKSKAIYGEASYELTDAVKLTAGLRYTMDKFAYKDALTTFYDDTGVPRLYTVSDYAPGGVFSNYLIGVSPGEANPLSRNDKSNALTGRAIIDFKPADNMLLYASFSRGYRGGTYNGLAFQSAAQVYFVKPEKVDAFEVGLKSRFLDNRLQFNVSAFHYKYRGQQNQILDPSAVTFLINLDGKLNGLDAELVFEPIDTVRLNAGLGLLDSKFDHGDCPTAPIPGVPPQVGNCIATRDGKIDVGGNPFPYASKISANFGIDWDVARVRSGTVTLHADTSYTGRYYYDVFGKYDYVGPQGTSTNAGTGPLGKGGGKYWLINGRISYIAEHFSIAGYVKNATNKLYYPNGINVEGPYGSDYLIRAAPRTFGVEVSTKF